MSGDFFHKFVTEYNVKKATNFDKPGDTLPGMSANATLVSLKRKTGTDSTLRAVKSLVILRFVRLVDMSQCLRRFRTGVGAKQNSGK